jgi:antitoxin component YwqK of YwqJK toxin-antitoxin module
MFSFTLSAQESKPPKYEKEGDLTKVVFFHDNGETAQTGYFKDKKRHGVWISYQDSGEKTAMGSYKMGMKNGQWFFLERKRIDRSDLRRQQNHQCPGVE